ncbi:oligosaccharide flippase family protein [Mycobacterium sp. ITM-2016-00317]|uniref:lipopolysaccharide biosynthesis protein n=1 Tax=Mycobacterium sp. ITM-2016-00317 TaxID=2099694 RepID=UPI00287FA8FF|nr:oligosaccharide flippase family protein [Mycobacterium sp. ITM-2016-00317]WNG90225.1 oligosaccharide flippase family protein [Mycobacterium sp. ITM-2016-00317]
MSLLTAPVLARVLGPDGRGLVATATAVLLLSPLLLSLGLPTRVRRLVVEDGDLRGVAWAVRKIAGIALLPACLLAVFLPDLLLPDSSHTVQIVFAAALVTTPASIVWICDVHILLGRGDYLAYGALNLAPSVSFAICVVGFGLSGMLTVSSAIGAFAAANVLNAVIVGFFVRPRVKPPRYPAVTLAKSSMPYYGAQLAQAAAFRLDQALIVALMGAQTAGLYSISVTISLIPVAFAQGLGAYAFRVAGSGNADIVPLIRASGILGFLLSGALASLVPFAVPLVFGEAFAASIPSVLIGLIGSVGLVFGYVACMCLAGQGRGGAMTLCQVVGSGVGIAGLAIASALGGGASSAACASALGYWVTAILSLFALKVPGAALVLRRDDFALIPKMLLSRS